MFLFSLFAFFMLKPRRNNTGAEKPPDKQTCTRCMTFAVLSSTSFHRVAALGARGSWVRSCGVCTPGLEL